MRARNIKPGFFDNEELAECSMSARLLYIGLWCLADRDGYVEYRPKKIRVKVFPYDSVNVVKLLDELIPFISFIGDRNEQFIKVEKFDKHQSPHKNEKPSNFNMLDSYRVITCKFTEFLPDCLIEDCLNPDSLTVDLLIDDCGASDDSQREYDFNEFWDSFEYKKGKGGAEQSWKKLKLTETIFQTILTGAKREAKNRAALIAKGGTAKMAQGWLTEKRWEDEHEETPSVGGQNKQTIASQIASTQHSTEGQIIHDY